MTKEQISIKNRIYREKHPDKVKENNDKFRKLYPDKVKENNQKWNPINNPINNPKYYNSEYHKKYRDKNKTYFRDMRLKHSFLITTEDYNNLLKSQGYVCAICGKPEVVISKGTLRSLSVDHDHKTGKIRGLLCTKCNTGLGVFLDNTKLLGNAINYLIKSNT